MKGKKDKAEWAVEIKFTSNHRKEVLVFGSEKEKQEWVTKIRKVQESSLFK
jgi:hypothetical protein